MKMKAKKNITKIEFLEKKFKKLKETLGLSEFKTKIDLTDHIKECRKIANNIVKNKM